MKDTKIEWADHTFNPWTGCTKVSPACDNCYAESWSKRAGAKVGKWGPGAPRVRTSEANWRQPLRWNADCAKRGVRESVFCLSLGDVFDNEVDRELRDDLATVIVSAPDLDWLLLTKRIGNAAKMLAEMFPNGMPPNVCLGATICNQTEADRDIPKLLATPAAKRFLSIEPMLGPIDLQKACTCACGNGGQCQSHHTGRRVIADSSEGGMLIECICSRLNGLDWVICGGESGPNARPMHPDWARSLRDQCQAAGVPFFFKQWGEWQPEYGMTRAQREKELGLHETVYVKLDGTTHWINEGDTTPYDASDAQMVKVGKKAAGRLLDGREWNKVPA